MNQYLMKSWLLVMILLLASNAHAQYDFELDRFMRNNNVQLIKLSKNGTQYGYACFLLRGQSNNKIKAKYFAKDAYAAFDVWKKNKNIILISSGAYSTGWDASTDTPVGLCVDNGKIVNRNIEDKMDGLVIVEAVGGVRVSDIKKSDLFLQSINRTISPIRDKYELMKWGEDQTATIFQTHLLGFENTLRINSGNSNKNKATRRMLVLGYSGGSLFHAIFHITKEVSLYEAANDVMETLKLRDINVVSILNLDTGGYNILEAYDDSHRQIPYITGDKDKKGATNLLIYYYD